MRKKTLIFLSLMGLSTSIGAQCVSSGFATAGNVTDNASIGVRAWSNTGNTTASDNAYCSTTALIIGENTHYLLCTNFGFSIPSTAIICGIEVQIERGESGLLANITDNSAKIVKAGSITGTEHASGTSWPLSDGNRTYGSSGDTWGLGWAPADVNASNFGLAFSANLGGISVLPSARIDQVKMRIWYDNTLPVELTRFTATCVDKNVLLAWETSTEIQNDHFEVQQSGNGIDFTSVASVQGNGTTNLPHVYEYMYSAGNENTAQYYRLVQVNFDGKTTPHEMVSVSCQETNTGIRAWQNQGLQIELNGFDQPTTVSVIDLSGHVIMNANVPINQQKQVVQMNNLHLLPGYYLVTAQHRGKTYTCKTIVVREE